MAIKKQYRTQNGLVLEYHRIALVSIDVNNQITLLRHSYQDEAARQYEKDYAEGKIEGEPSFPYVDYEYMTLDYEDDMTVARAYDWLKKRPGFEGASDI